MIDLSEIQKRVYQNKIDKKFNVTDVYMEFCYIYGELAEACDAYIMKKDGLGEELADVALYLLGISEILGIDLESEIINKLEIVEKRRYTQKNGVNIRLSD